ncbi:hypothetical protein ACP4OV_001376 [Aristida adscensionis]
MSNLTHRKTDMAAKSLLLLGFIVASVLVTKDVAAAADQFAESNEYKGKNMKRTGAVVDDEKAGYGGYGGGYTGPYGGGYGGYVPGRGWYGGGYGYSGYGGGYGGGGGYARGGYGGGGGDGGGGNYVEHAYYGGRRGGWH